MKVLFASSEVAPFASTGGLGEVSRSLPAELHRAGAEAIRVMPMYRQVLEGRLASRDTGHRLRIPVGFRVHVADVWVHEDPDVPTYFIRRDEYFDRTHLYAQPDRPYADNLERFAFFQKAVVALIDALGWKIDIVHGNDWTCGLIPFYLRHGINGAGREGREATVFTVHNLAYQGIYPGAEFGITNLPYGCFSVDGLEFYGNINCMKGGLTSSRVSTTVSRAYAEEVRSPEHGYGLDGVIRALGDRFVGIANGVDGTVWNPASDALIACRYGPDDLAGKAVCKSALLDAAGFDPTAQTPVVGMISRMIDDKGFDVLSDILPEAMELPLRLVILGTGDVKYEDLCREANRRWSDRFHAWIGYDERKAHMIQSGADVFLMPSRTEPCGLSQIFALAYGTIPIVHSVGGLKDTIQDLSPDGAEGNGFRFDAYTGDALLEALRRAIELYRDAEAWNRLRSRVMREDHSWAGPVREYLRVYSMAMGGAA